MTNFLIKYDLSKKYIDNYFLETGLVINSDKFFSINCATLPPEIRALILPLLNIGSLHLGAFDQELTEPLIIECLQSYLKKLTESKQQITKHTELKISELESNGFPEEFLDSCQKLSHTAYSSKLIELIDFPPESFNLVKMFEPHNSVTQTVSPELANRFHKLLETLESLVQAKRTELKQIEQAKQDAIKQDKDDFLSDFLQWVNNHGSDRLKLALKFNYEIGAIYAEERSQLDFPNSVLFGDNDLEWELKVNPSLKALQFIDDLSDKTLGKHKPVIAKITQNFVYDTKPLLNSDERLPDEVVLIDSYLYDYCLVIMIN